MKRLLDRLAGNISLLSRIRSAQYLKTHTKTHIPLTPPQTITMVLILHSRLAELTTPTIKAKPTLHHHNHR
jgi:hypothetical protein